MLLSAEDSADLIPSGEAFFREFGLYGRFDGATFASGWARLIRAGVGVSIVIRDQHGSIEASIGAVLNTDFFTGDKIAVESFYYAMPSSRGRALSLLRLMEEECVRRGCKRIWMIHLENERAELMQKFYERRGYELKEKLYMKELR